MKKGEHTPGPWNVEHDTEIIAAEGKRIAEADTRSINFVNGEANANASLIAAAPDLLAACEAVALRHGDDGLCWCVIPIPAGTAHHMSCQRMRGAIKKARGTL